MNKHAERVESHPFRGVSRRPITAGVFSIFTSSCINMPRWLCMKLRTSGTDPKIPPRCLYRSASAARSHRLSHIFTFTPSVSHLSAVPVTGLDPCDEAHQRRAPAGTGGVKGDPERAACGGMCHDLSRVTLTLPKRLENATWKHILASYSKTETILDIHLD